MAGVYCHVSNNFIMNSLNEWNRICNSSGKSETAIEADRKKLRQLCQEAADGIENVIKKGQMEYDEDRKNQPLAIR